MIAMGSATDQYFSCKLLFSLELAPTVHWHQLLCQSDWADDLGNAWWWNAIAIFDRPSQVYDWLLTADSELTHVWSRRWGIIELLYLLSRYMPFVDTPVMLIYREVPAFHPCPYLEHLSQCRLLLGGSEHWSMSHCSNSTMQWVAAIWPGFHRSVTY